MSVPATYPLPRITWAVVVTRPQVDGALLAPIVRKPSPHSRHGFASARYAMGVATQMRRVFPTAQVDVVKVVAL